jgi:hypothetical protein
MKNRPLGRTKYLISEVFTTSEQAAAINAAHQLEMASVQFTDIQHMLFLMGLDNAGLIERYGGRGVNETST